MHSKYLGGIGSRFNGHGGRRRCTFCHKEIANEREDRLEIGALIRDGKLLGEQWRLRDGVPKFARGAIERDRRGGETVDFLD
ncbi:hypothetical protein J1N35_001091 [Gossypium stocksii]|uniref:Uncharacterized protein n=1 Tax=Gossypium stocksii TaxID=47602 RepID=A0A9D3WJJ1_9ROSI|nr:hypothetical protein J1N35_001091 [Gossypium stocksii]